MYSSTKANRLEPWIYDKELYKKRNEVERLFGRLKTFQGLTPQEFIVNTWGQSPKLFHLDPTHYKMGLYI
jgi:transposase, IS4 family